MNARRFAIATGVIVALFMVVLVHGWRMPDRVVGLLGGATGVDRWGGVTATLHTTTGDTTAVAIPEIDRLAADDTLDYLRGGGVKFRIVREPRFDRDRSGSLPMSATLEIDSWRADEGGIHSHPFLQARTRALVEAAADTAIQTGWWQLPADSMVAVERVDSYGRQPTLWRTYELERTAELDSSAIASAAMSYDPNTNRPVVLLDFTREAAQTFCDLTRRIVGDKLATTIGSRVYSAPVINGAICGGRAQITMGGNDPDRAEALARSLVALFAQPARPDATVTDFHWQPPGDVATQERIARLALAAIGGIVAAVLAFALVRTTRPRWRTRPALPDGAFPWKRFAVTMLAPIAMYVLPTLTLPGINEIEASHLFRGQWYDVNELSLFALGVTPLTTAFILIELVALAIPRLRWRRHDPRGRIGLGKAVAVLALVVALVQGWFVSGYLESLAHSGAELVAAPGLKFRIIVTLSLAGGTALLAVLAGMIREHGLGNGYGALIASAPIVMFGRRVAFDPFVVVDGATAILAVIVVAVATACVLRWRIGGGERQPEQRVPGCGLEVTAGLGGIGYLLVALTAIGLGYGLEDIMYGVAQFQGHTWVIYGSLVVFIPIWSWIMARPGVVARVAMQAGLEPPSRCMWARGVVISIVVFVFGFIAGQYARGASSLDAWIYGKTVSAMIAAAVILDIVDDARARRSTLVPAGVIHQIQWAGVIERVLADAGIACHIHASNLRTLLAFFGPWAPAIVLVPADKADAARALVDGATRQAVADVPVARVAS